MSNLGPPHKKKCYMGQHQIVKKRYRTHTWLVHYMTTCTWWLYNKDACKSYTEIKLIWICIIKPPTYYARCAFYSNQVYNEPITGKHGKLTKKTTLETENHKGSNVVSLTARKSDSYCHPRLLKESFIHAFIYLYIYRYTKNNLSMTNRICW